MLDPYRPSGLAAMLIRCPTCCAAYDLPPEVLGGPGRVLRCAECREAWVLQEGFDAPEIVAETRSGRRLPAPPPAEAPRAVRPAGVLRRFMAGAAGTALVVASVSAGMAAIAFKDKVVRLVPQSAALFATIGLPVNLRGLAIGEVHGTIGSDPGGANPVLMLEGRISNLRRHPTHVPDLRIVVRDKARNELYSWSAPAPKPKLDAGETTVFRARLSAPPQDGQEIVVSFADPAAAPPKPRSADDRR